MEGFSVVILFAGLVLIILPLGFAMWASAANRKLRTQGPFVVSLVLGVVLLSIAIFGVDTAKEAIWTTLKAVGFCIVLVLAWLFLESS